MQLHIRGQESLVLNCEPNETVAAIKERISAAWNVNDFALYCAGSPLTDETVAADLPSNEIDFNVALLGGKVHGSLARAGKVKAQTPKVEKLEKSKKKTGRAKRRIQYNRRFVNVVQSFGRRRGPNANPNS